jgi:hypothetical protein
VYKWYKNLPASYSWSVYNTNPTNWFPFWADPYVVDRVVLFEWEISELENSLTARTQFFEDLQTSYSWTTISTESDIAYLLEIDSSSSGEASNYVATSFNNSLKTSIAIVAVSSWWESIPSDWRTQDLNCDKADIVLGTQIWAACNSTLWTWWLEYWDGSACYDYLWWNTTWCNRASNEKENIWNPTYGIDNIWWKLYRYNSLDTNNDDVIDSNDTNFVCGTWYHVPSLVEWTTLTDYLTSNNGDNKIWWLGHTTKDDTNNLVQALQLPLPGSIYPDFFNPEVLIFSNRWSTIRLWTADSNNSSVSKMIYTHSAYDWFFFSTNWQDTAYSIRCIKD